MVVARRIVSSGLPFYWRVAAPDADSPFDFSTLPFEFDIEGPDWLLQQHVTERLRSALDAVYDAEFNIGYLQPGYDIARGYLDDLISVLDPILSRISGPGRVLEIGCGGCEVLAKIQALGHKVLGMDPSPIAQRWAEARNIPLIPARFDSSLITTGFSLAYCSDVLEHLEQPVQFLQDLRSVVVPGGSVLVAVPDCTWNIANFDVSPAMHQHLNYFTQHSLLVCLANAGLRNVRVVKSGYGGSLYGWGDVADGSGPESDSEHPEVLGSEERMARRERSEFLENFADQLDRVRNEIVSSLDRREVCAFYAPLRALPYLAPEIVASHKNRIRLVDDTAHWHGKCFEGLPLPIESLSDLKQHKPDRIFIMSITFEQQLLEKVQPLSIDGVQVTLLSQMLTL